jgi:glyoxylase-like metal-dependent hydrolase (beta-lactamase superfamily II)
MFIRSNTHRMLSYIFAFVALGLLLGYGNAFAATPVGTITEIPGMKGKVTINDRGKAKIHTYAFSPLNSTTHIIETADGLVVVDAQMTLSDTNEAIAYVRSLTKPIRRLIVSHSHPDHWLGLGEWGDAPSAAIADVKTYINGEKGPPSTKASKKAFRRTASLALRSRTSRAGSPTSCRKAKS